MTIVFGEFQERYKWVIAVMPPTLATANFTIIFTKKNKIYLGTLERYKIFLFDQEIEYVYI